jgi:hypothetical protein
MQARLDCAGAPPCEASSRTKEDRIAILPRAPTRGSSHPAGPPKELTQRHLTHDKIAI